MFKAICAQVGPAVILTCKVRYAAGQNLHNFKAKEYRRSMTTHYNLTQLLGAARKTYMKINSQFSLRHCVWSSA